MKEHAAIRVKNAIYFYFLRGDLEGLVCCSDFSTMIPFSGKIADLIKLKLW